MSPLEELREQILDLEIRLAYSDRRVAALDDVVLAFAARVETLERELNAIKTPAAATPTETTGAPPAQDASAAFK